MQLSKINNKGILCIINFHQNEKNGQKGHKTAQNSPILSVEKGYNHLNLQCGLELY